MMSAFSVKYFFFGLFNIVSYNFVFDVTVNAVFERLATTLRVVGSIPARNQYVWPSGSYSEKKRKKYMIVFVSDEKINDCIFGCSSLRQFPINQTSNYDSLSHRTLSAHH